MRFILVDRILALERGQRALFLKNVSQSEDYFDDHFPGFPIMPGVLILEGFAQGSQFLIAFTHDFACYPEIRDISRAAFKHYVVPGDSLELSLVLSRQDGNEVWVEGKALARDRVMAEAVIRFELMNERADAQVRERCRRLEALYHLLSSDPVARAWEGLAQSRTGK